MNLPNFLIIGAPKAGTTALYFALKQHPEIYMSPNKEPWYFVYEGKPPVFPAGPGIVPGHVRVWRPRDYLMLFAQVTNQRAIGEASTAYLYTPISARRISQTLPQSRLIAVLRQPAERAYSHYAFLRQRHVEPARTFEEALDSEETRLRKAWRLEFCYKTLGYYHRQLSLYDKSFAREQIKVYLYDDWQTTPQAMLCDLFRFLQVDENFVPEIKRSNVTLLPKSQRLHDLARQPEGIDQRSPFLPVSIRRALLSVPRRLDRRFNRIPPPPLAPETRARLTDDFREDILKLQDRLGRDLSHWC